MRKYTGVIAALFIMTAIAACGGSSGATRTVKGTLNGKFTGASAVVATSSGGQTTSSGLNESSATAFTTAGFSFDLPTDDSYTLTVTDDNGAVVATFYYRGGASTRATVSSFYLSDGDTDVDLGLTRRAGSGAYPANNPLEQNYTDGDGQDDYNDDDDDNDGAPDDEDCDDDNDELGCSDDDHDDDHEDDHDDDSDDSNDDSPDSSGGNGNGK